MPGCLPSKATTTAIRAVRAKGHKAFLSTGRLEAYVDKNVLAVGFDGGIFSAGGRIVVDGKTILDLPMSADLVRRIIDVLLEDNVPFMVESSQGVYTRDGRLLRDVEDLKGHMPGAKQTLFKA